MALGLLELEDALKDNQGFEDYLASEFSANEPQVCDFVAEWCYTITDENEQVTEVPFFAIWLQATPPSSGESNCLFRDLVWFVGALYDQMFGPVPKYTPRDKDDQTLKVYKKDAFDCLAMPCVHYGGVFEGHCQCPNQEGITPSSDITAFNFVGSGGANKGQSLLE